MQHMTTNVFVIKCCFAYYGDHSLPLNFSLLMKKSIICRRARGRVGFISDGEDDLFPLADTKNALLV